VQGHGTGTFSGVAGFGGASQGEGIFGQGGGTSGAGVVGVAAGAPNPGAGLKVGVYGSGGAGTGVYGVSSGGLGAAFTGGVAPLRLVPNATPAAALTASGHQAGELYVTSDNLLYFCDGTHWRQVLLAPLPGTTPTLPPGPPRVNPPAAGTQGSAGTQEGTAMPTVPTVPPPRP
jgi:hypothetical protein